MGTWKGVSGMSHPGTPITPDMAFGIASNTKLFTGVLLLKLAAHNIIHLDDALHTYLPPFNHIDPSITIRQLLNHTSGLADVTSVPGYPDSILNDPNRFFTPSELLTWASPPLFPAGTGWNYCNTNYLLAGLVAERATGQPFNILLRDSILTPLQLDSTFLDVYDSLLYPVAHPWQAGVNNISIPRVALNSAAWAAGAMYATSGEMAQWYHALMNGQVLEPHSFQDMTTFVGSGNYGIGISRATVAGRTVWTHGGTIWGGYNSSMMYDTASGIVLCVLINQLPAQAYQVAIQLLLALTNQTVGTDEQPGDTNQVVVFPNPSRDWVQVDVPDRETLQAVRIFDAAGRFFLETREPRFSIVHWPSGPYWIHILTEEGVYVRPLRKH
jgi:D-alanyl-D-alanine carboxypeptidase